VYLTPNRAKGLRYYYGSRNMRPGAASDSFDYGNGHDAAGVPKISIHESGRVHIRIANTLVAGPLQIPRLRELEGVHVATVQPDAMDALPVYGGNPFDKCSDSQHAYVVSADDADENCRVVMWIGREPRFRQELFVRSFNGAGWGSPLYLAIGVIENKLLLPGRKGITLLAGMDPGAGVQDSQSFLWVTSKPSDSPA
jgi:hypothetical protein